MLWHMPWVRTAVIFGSVFPGAIGFTGCEEFITITFFAVWVIKANDY
jgi:hypothetical protein